MTDQQWKRALELYETAAELPESAAQALLNTSREEIAVLQKVSKLLNASTESDAASSSLTKARFAGCLIGRYDEIDLLGCGSTGEVYTGRDRELGRSVALKIMSAEYAILSSSSQRFMREAQASSALNHPNIVTVHEVIMWNASPVIVMELVEGKPLRALCGQPMPVEIAVPIASQIMKALAVAHANGIVHRDLKPENVIVRPDGYVKVLDFGLARRSFLQTAAGAGAGEGSSTEGLPIGTLRYMSPEQCRGETATPSSDVFAAGIVIYEMLAGQHPFHADSPLDTAHAIAWIEPRPLRQLNPGVPDAMDRLVHAMLAKVAASRPSAEQVVKALAACSDEPVLKPVRSRAVFWLYAGFIAALLAAGIFWLREVSPGAKLATSPQELDLKIAALANLLGTEHFPDPSPDGTRVAFGFSSESSPVRHIYVKELGSSKLTQLTKDTLADSEPIFSPDGSRIAFLRRQDGHLYVMIMPAGGGIEQKVSEISDSGLPLRIMTWDGQGENLIVSDGLGKVEAQIALFAISLDTGMKRQITFPKPRQIDCMPVVSPDRRSLGFARLNEEGVGVLWAIPIAAALTASGETKKQRLIASTDLIVCWNWSADGHDLLVSRMVAGKAHLWRYPFKTGVGSGAAVRVVGLDDEVTQTSVSRLADRFIYTGQTTRTIGIWNYPLKPSTAAGKRLIASANLDVDARYSPDGKNIVFASARAGFGQVDLWMCASDGSNQHQISSSAEPGPHSTGSPSWSTDGRWIAFDATPQGISSIYLLDVLGGKPKRLTNAGSWDGVPSWSHDGRWIYYCSDRNGGRNIWRLPLSGGPSVQITHDGGFESYESPDGRFLYHTKQGKSGIWRMALPDGKEEFLAGLATVFSRFWEGSAKGIYFVSTSETPFLQFFNFSNQQVTRIREMPVAPAGVYGGLSVAPNGRNMLYLQVDPGRTNVMVVSNFH